MERSTLNARIWQWLWSGCDRRASLLRYLITGSIIFAIDFAIWITCVGILDWDVRPSQVVSRSAGALAGFFGHKYFTFGPENGKWASNLAMQGGGYTIVTIFNIMISPFIVFVAIKSLQGLPGALIGGKVLADALLAAETYILLRFLFVQGRQS